jgi:hypothetical protein
MSRGAPGPYLHLDKPQVPSLNVGPVEAQEVGVWGQWFCIAIGCV